MSDYVPLSAIVVPKLLQDLVHHGYVPLCRRGHAAKMESRHSQSCEGRDFLRK